MPYKQDRSSTERGFAARLREALRRQHGHASERGSTHRLLGSLMIEDGHRPALPASIPADTRAGHRDLDAARDLTGDEVDADGSFAAGFEGDLAVFEAGERLKGQIEDHQLDALARMHAAAQAELAARDGQSWVGRTPFAAREAVVMEVSAATGLGEADLAARVELATGSALRVGFLREQVRSGAASLRRACAVLVDTGRLDDARVDRVARAALAPTRDGAGLTDRLFRSRLRRAIIAADTEAESRSRQRRARDRIGVFGQVFDDGTGSLTVVNDADKIAAALDRADAAARAARARGDRRSLDELRADFLTGAAIHGWPSSDPGFGFAPLPAGRVFIVVPWTVAASPDQRSQGSQGSQGSQDPCELPGHGWVSAEQARTIITAKGSIWQTLLAEPTTGRALGLSTGYRPSRAILEHIRAVDGICRGPGCQIPARQCDVDHDQPWPGGPTGVDNLTAKHRAHHRVRTAGWWSADRDECDPDSAVLTWRTAAGRTYATHPKDWLEGHRPADPDARPAAGAPPGPSPVRASPTTHDPPPF